MDQPTTPHPIAPQALSEIQSLLSEMEATYPAAHVGAMDISPLWADDIKAVSSEWAQALSDSINWLDHVPHVLMITSKDHETPQGLPSYAEIGAAFEKLLKEVSEPRTPGLLEKAADAWKSQSKRLDGLNAQEKLDRLIEQKKLISDGSRFRLRGIRSAITLGEEAQHLSVLIAEAIPQIKSAIQNELIQLTSIEEDSTFQLQRNARRRKQLERASGALDMVSQRVAHEASSEAVSGKQGLDEIVRQEELLHVRINTLVSQITKVISGEQINTIARTQGAEMASVATSVALPAPSAAASAPTLPVLAKDAATTPKSGFFSFLFNADAKPKRAKMSDYSKDILNSLHRRGRFINLTWVDFKTLIEKDVNVLPTTMVKGYKKPLADIMVSEKFWTHRETPNNAANLLETLLMRQPEALEKQLNGDLVRQAVIYRLRHDPKNRAGWSVLALASIDHPLTEIEKPSVMAIAAAALSEQYSPPDRQAIDNIAAIINSQIPLDILEETMCKNVCLMSSSFNPFERIYDRLPSAHASLIRREFLVRKIFNYPTPEDQALLDLLSPSDLRQFAEKTMVSGHEGSEKWLRAALKTASVQADMATPPTKETQWMQALPDYLRMRKKEAKTQEIPVSVLALALSMKSSRLLDQIQSYCRPALFRGYEAHEQAQDPLQRVADLYKKMIRDDATPSAGFWDTSVRGVATRSYGLETTPLFQVMALRDELEKGRHADPSDFWGEALAGNINTPCMKDPSNSNEPPMTPLMRACDRGDMKLINALMKHGADFKVQAHGATAGVYLYQKVLADVLEHDSNKSKHLRGASQETRNTFFRKILHTIHQTGIWDLNATEKAGSTQLLSAAVFADARQPPNQARRDAIESFIREMKRHDFIAWTNEPPMDAFKTGWPDRQTLLDYGVSSGLIESANVEDEVVHNVKMEALENAHKERRELFIALQREHGGTLPQSNRKRRSL